MKKKRNKRYAPKRVYANPLIFNAMPEVTKERVDLIETLALTRFKMIEDGTATLRSMLELKAHLAIGFKHSVAFDHSSEYQGLFLIAGCACELIGQFLRAKVQIQPDILKPIAAAIDVHTQMMQSASHKELNTVMLQTCEEAERMLKVANGASFFFAPKTDDRTLIGRVGMTFINGMFRTGYLARNEAFDRFEWVDPVNAVKVPVTEFIVIVLEKPLREKVLKEAGFRQ